MLDLRRIREDPDGVRKALARRGPGVADAVDGLLELDATRRSLITQHDSLKADQKRRGKEVARAAPADREALTAGLKDLSTQIEELADALRATDETLRDLLARTPNLPADDVPVGGEDEGVELRRVGDPPSFDFEVRDHAALGELLQAIDMVRGAKVSGARFGFLTGPGALLEMALGRFALDRATAAGFLPMLPPVLVRRDAMYGTGFLPTDEQQIFRTADDDLYLVGTSEVPLVSYHADEILDPAALPRRYVGLSACFRREAGSYGKDTRGMFRVHQFQKLEMVSFVQPEASAEEHEFLLGQEEALLQDLEIPYRVVNIAAGDLGGSAAKKYDCEAWFPSQQTWRELTSTSNCTDYQARRIACRTRTPDGQTRPVHTLNGTLVTTRWILALLENHQREDGSVLVPAALQPYLHMNVLSPPA